MGLQEDRARQTPGSSLSRRAGTEPVAKMGGQRGNRSGAGVVKNSIWAMVSWAY